MVGKIRRKELHNTCKIFFPVLSVRRRYMTISTVPIQMTSPIHIYSIWWISLTMGWNYSQTMGGEVCPQKWPCLAQNKIALLKKSLLLLWGIYTTYFLWNLVLLWGICWQNVLSLFVTVCIYLISNDWISLTVHTHIHTCANFWEGHTLQLVLNFAIQTKFNPTDFHVGHVTV